MESVAAGVVGAPLVVESALSVLELEMDSFCCALILT